MGIVLKWHKDYAFHCAIYCQGRRQVCKSWGGGGGGLTPPPLLLFVHVLKPFVSISVIRSKRIGLTLDLSYPLHHPLLFHLLFAILYCRQHITYVDNPLINYFNQSHHKQ